MNPRLLIRRGKEAIPIIVEGEEPSSPSSFTKRFGFGNKIRKKESKSSPSSSSFSKPPVPIRSRPHIVIRVESEDRSDRDSQSRYQPSSDRSRPVAEAGTPPKERVGQSADPPVSNSSLNSHSKGLAPVLEEDGSSAGNYTNHSPTVPYGGSEPPAAQKPIERTSATKPDERRNVPPASKGTVTFVDNISMWEDDSQWVAFEDPTFYSDLQSRSSLSFFGADVFADIPSATMSDQSLTPSLMRNGTNQTIRSQTRRVDVDELFKRDVLPPSSSSLRASSFQSAPSFQSPQSFGSNPSHVESSLPTDPVLMDRVSEDAEEDFEEEEEELGYSEMGEGHEEDLRSPVSQQQQAAPKSILRNSGYASKDRNGNGDDAEYVSEEDGISDILGEFDPDDGPVGHVTTVAADWDQTGSTHAEDGSYDDTTDDDDDDDVSDEDYDETTEGNNGTDTEGGLEASDSFESATLLDMLGEAVIAIWEDLGPSEPKASRRRSRPAHNTGTERSHRTRRTYE